MRLQPDGGFDATFGSRGQYELLTGFVSNFGDTLIGVSVLPDGRIVTAGDQRGSSGRVYFVTRNLP